jgi:hypothetical protein
MRIIVTLFLLLFFCELKAQTRIFFSAGTNVNATFSGEPNFNLGLANNSLFIGSETYDASFGRYLCADLTTERRLYGTYYWLTGLKFHQSGYRYAQSVYTSTYKSSYISVPLLVRVNYINRNFAYFDLGFMQNFLLNANLHETFYDISAHGNIAKHLSRFSSSFYFETSFAYRRVSFSFFFQSKAFVSSDDFSSEWGLERKRSVFLLYYSNHSFAGKGMKLIYRIR